MRRIFIIWVVAVLLLLLLIVQGVTAGIFNNNMGLVYRWVAINLVPLSGLLAWSFYTGKTRSGPLTTTLLIVFCFGCLTSLYARNFLPPASAYESFLRLFGYAPFFLLPLQLLTAIMLLRDNKPDQSIRKSVLAGRGARVREMVGEAYTLEALDLALETVGDQDEAITQRLLTLKNTLVKAREDAGMLLISTDELRAVEARVANSLLVLCQP